MSAPMCSVPTKNGDVEVPVGTLIWLDGEFPALADKGGYQTVRSRLGDGNPFRYGNRIAVIIAIPNGRGGWTVLDATTPDATTPEPQWIALTPEQVAALPDRAPVRVEFEGVSTEGPLHRERTRDDSIYLHYSAGIWWAGPLPRAVIHAHPDDVPDPEADLIERAAREIEEVISTSARWSDYQRAARAVIAMVRGEQA